MGDDRGTLDREAAAWMAGLIGAKHARREPTKNPACFAPRKRLILCRMPQMDASEKD